MKILQLEELITILICDLFVRGSKLIQTQIYLLITCSYVLWRDILAHLQMYKVDARLKNARMWIILPYDGKSRQRWKWTYKSEMSISRPFHNDLYFLIFLLKELLHHWALVHLSQVYAIFGLSKVWTLVFERQKRATFTTVQNIKCYSAHYKEIYMVISKIIALHYLSIAQWMAQDVLAYFRFILYAYKDRQGC